MNICIKPVLVTAMLAFALTALAQQAQEASTVEYPAAFFTQYHPNTALDMVKQLPGFQLDDGESTRGFSTAAGNVLINGRRPNVKQDTPSSMLSRIPARNVIRIDLIRGQVAGVDMQGNQVLVNLIMREESPAAVRWEAFGWKNAYSGTVMPGGSISLSDKWNGFDFNTGLEGNRHVHVTKGPRDLVDGNGNLLEDRHERGDNTHLTLSGNLNATGWVGQTLLQVNTELGFDDITDKILSIRRPVAAAGRDEFHDETRRSHDVELGLTAERELADKLTGKSILIFTQIDLDTDIDKTTTNLAGQQTQLRISNGNKLTTEAIGRLEFTWGRFVDHAIQLNGEFAFNQLDNELVQTTDTGVGAVVDFIPGANTKVEEVRGDFLLKDTWSLGVFELDYGLGAETSTISQTGDAELERDFFFLKPHTVLNYTPERGRQTRLRLAREISQLNFNDFVSTAVFQDDDLALGNPNLSPDKTWALELSQEQRYGDIGVIKVTGFYHWIKDVVDLLPLTSEFEAPGNIGDGRRWGVKIENTIPLGWVGLENARLNLRARWQDSSVTDPVTGEKRTLSGESGLVGVIPYKDEDVKYTAAIDFRQDFQQAKVAWGWETRFRDKRVLYKVNELDTFDEGTEISLFTETTRWFGVKIRATLKDLLNIKRSRVRTSYVGERALSPIRNSELIDSYRGRQLDVVVSGSF